MLLPSDPFATTLTLLGAFVLLMTFLEKCFQVSKFVVPFLPFSVSLKKIKSVPPKAKIYTLSG